MKIYVIGSSLTSCYWNGAATYYRGIYKNLHRLGHDITFAEPDIYKRQQNRDCEDLELTREVRSIGDERERYPGAGGCDGLRSRLFDEAGAGCVPCVDQDEWLAWLVQTAKECGLLTSPWGSELPPIEW